MTDLSPEARALLDAMGDTDGPAPGRRERVHRALAAGLAVTAAGQGASAALKVAQGMVAVKSAASSLLLYAVAGATVATIAAAPAYWSAARGRPAAAYTPVAADRATAVARPSLSNQPLGSVPPTLFDSPESPIVHEHAQAAPHAVQPPRAVQITPPAASSVPRTRGPSALAHEMQLLEAAQRALRAKQPQQALAWLDRYREEVRGAVLSDEERILRVLSLCELGRHEEARQQARALETQAPSSPLLPRLRASCAFRQSARE